MAKMFYTLEEAASKLGVGEAEVKQMAEDGKLQQFRDRDKLMFKREQVDEMAEGGVPMESGDTIDLSEEAHAPDEEGSSMGATATGISVFDTDEVALADPMAQTQVTSPSESGNDDSELTLESVGSGSGLLDLTHEPDETSLGAMALLDDIGGEDSDAKMASASDDSAEGSAVLGASDTSLLDAIGSESDTLGEIEGSATGAPAGIAYMPIEEARDPVGDAWGGATLLGVFAVLVSVLIVTLTGIQGLVIKYTAFLAMSEPGTPKAKPDMNTLGMWSFLMLIGCFVLGIIGLFIGKSLKRKATA